MIHQSIKISLRRLLKFKVQTFINVTGLGIAMAVCLVILLFTHHHFSYDRFIEDGKNSYRLISRYGDGTFNANTFACYDDLLSECPEIKSHTTCYTTISIDGALVGNKKTDITEAIFIQSSFLDYFSIELKEGVKESIDEPNTIFITPELAKNLFPRESAIGQTVMLNTLINNRDSLLAYTITGVVNPLPENSHLTFEMLVSQNGHFNPVAESQKRYKRFSAATYVKLHSSADINKLEEQLINLPEPFLEGQHGPPLHAFNHRLQPIHDIHFTPETVMEMRPTIRRSSLNILIVVGMLILAMAAVNFLNMHLATNSHFKKQSGIIRYLGGNKKHLILNSYTELFILVFVSFFLALLLTILTGNSVSTYLMSNWTLPINSSSFWHLSIGFFAGVLILISMLSLINISTILTPSKSILQTNKSPLMVPLLIFQFIMVIALIGYTILINKQVNYISQKPLGYTSENIIVIEAPIWNEKVKILRDELMNSPGVISAASAQHYPGYRLQDMSFTNRGNSFPFKFGHIDKFTTRTLNMSPLIYFNEQNSDATSGWLINETFYNQLKVFYSEEQIATSNFPTDEAIENDASRSQFIILGVVKDFHYASLHNPIENFAFYVRDDNSMLRFVLVSFNQKEVKNVVQTIENKVSELFPGHNATYSFIDEQLNNQYASEQTLMRLINFFSVLTFLIACFGLIGLSLFFNEQRTKEIGIRKVNGARISEVLVMLNKDFVKWVAIAFVIATPIAWYAMIKWLQNFAYKTEMSWWIFALAGVLALGIALLTVSWQSWRAARRNPVEALRYE